MDERNVQRPHRLHVQSTRNNTIVTLTTPAGDTLASASGGTVGFKKAGRSGYEAGYRAAFRVFDQIAENRGRWRLHALEVLWNGFGQGREAVFRAMMASEGELVRSLVKTMTDKTPIKVGGVRPKKRRSTLDACGASAWLTRYSAVRGRSIEERDRGWRWRVPPRLTLDPRECLARLGQAGLLALHHARVALEHAVLGEQVLDALLHLSLIHI